MTRLDLDIGGVADYALEQLAPGMKAGALYLTGEVKAEISEQGTGRSYKRGKKVHIASAPGMAPASDTGRLLNATQPMDLKRTRDTLTTGVVQNTDYAEALAVGTENMAPRPSLEPTLASRLSGMAQVIQANVK